LPLHGGHVLLDFGFGLVSTYLARRNQNEGQRNCGEISHALEAQRAGDTANKEETCERGKNPKARSIG
jgi:hypothetical protein